MGLRAGIQVAFVSGFAQDDPEQSERAKMAIDGLGKSRPGYVTMTVLNRDPLGAAVQLPARTPRQ